MKRLVTALRHPHDYEWLALRPWRRHSQVLVVAGAMYVCIGLVFMLPIENPTRDSALRVPLTWLPLAAWGVAFVIVGIGAMVSSRWPPASETWGYSALSGLSALWASFYACGLALGAGFNAVPGIFVWVLVSFLWWAIAGLHNSEDMAVLDEGA